jgi:hypothetical protein
MHTRLSTQGRRPLQTGSRQGCCVLCLGRLPGRPAGPVQCGRAAPVWWWWLVVARRRRSAYTVSFMQWRASDCACRSPRRRRSLGCAIGAPPPIGNGQLRASCAQSIGHRPAALAARRRTPPIGRRLKFNQLTDGNRRAGDGRTPSETACCQCRMNCARPDGSRPLYLFGRRSRVNFRLSLARSLAASGPPASSSPNGANGRPQRLPSRPVIAPIKYNNGNGNNLLICQQHRPINHGLEWCRRNKSRARPARSCPAPASS